MAHPDLDALLNHLLPFALQMLEDHGEFHPFAAAMTRAGELQPSMAHTGDEHPPAQELIDLILAGFRQERRAGKLRATGICFDVRVVVPGQTEKTDAVCVRVEHENGEAVDVYQPYRKEPKGALQLGELFASAGPRQIFAADAKS